MSDDDYMYDEEEEENWDYEGDDGEDEQGGDKEAEIEQLFYQAKDLKESKKFDKAIETLLEMMKAEGEDKSEYGFKGLKLLCKLLFLNKKHDDGLKWFNKYLTYFDQFSSNETENGVNSILTKVTAALPIAVVQQLYDKSLQAFLKNKNERVWFRLKLKLGTVMLEGREFGQLSQILNDLEKSCKSPDGTDDQKKGTQLMEIYAMQIQMYTETKDAKKLREIYEKALRSIQSAITHPKIVGIIRECGGKMYMAEKDWASAYNDFFEAFKAFDDTGAARRIQCLKYCVLANMLRLSEIDVFEEPAAKPYKNDPEITSMTALVAAYQVKNIKHFEKILKDNEQSLLGDPFVRLYIQDLLRNIRTQYLQETLKPYTRIRLGYLASVLQIPGTEVEDLLVTLILDGKIKGQIDQVEQILVLEQTAQSSLHSQYQSMSKWATQLANLSRTQFNQLAAT